MTTKLQHYLDLPYAVEIVPDDGGFLASVLDLPGCMSSGDTAEAALKGLKEAKELWIEGRLDAGEPIPEPSEESDYSGKFVLRLPRSLHRDLDLAARRDGTSLNQYVLRLLAERNQLSQVQGLMTKLAHMQPRQAQVVYLGVQSAGSITRHWREASRALWAEPYEVGVTAHKSALLHQMLGNIEHVPKPPSGKKAFKQVFQYAFAADPHGK